jgi:hypothetical protein
VTRAAIAGPPSLALVMALLGACRSSAFAELDSLAESAPLPYSALVTGGAFVEGGEAAGPLARTFLETEPHGEAIALDTIRAALGRGRVFERTERDARGAVERAAALRGAGPQGADELLAVARAGGHDFLLVVERLDDREVQVQGINGQWPITASVWLLIGLGMVIPDHTYESRASLRVSIRDAQTGAVLHPMVFDAGPVDLSLIERTDIWGLLQSVIVPPFWVGDDPARVVATVRATTAARVVTKLCRELKSIAVRQRLAASMPAQITVARLEGAVRVEIEAAEGLSFVRVAVDGAMVAGEAAAAFADELLGSVIRAPNGRLVYAAVYRGPPAGEYLRVLAQTISGGVASTTVRIDG